MKVNESKFRFVENRDLKGERITKELSRCCNLPFVVLPDFDGVDDVLPENVAAGTDAGEGIEIDRGEPDGESGVLLAECLAGFLGVVEVMTYEAANSELNDANDET